MATATNRELIGVAEIADLADVRTSAVSNWASRWSPETRTPFPIPVARTRMGPVYDKAEVLRWLIATGRYQV